MREYVIKFDFFELDYRVYWRNFRHRHNRLAIAFTINNVTVKGVDMSDLSFTQIGQSCSATVSYVDVNGGAALNPPTDRVFTWSTSDATITALDVTSGPVVNLSSVADGAATITVGDGTLTLSFAAGTTAAVGTTDATALSVAFGPIVPGPNG